MHTPQLKTIGLINGLGPENFRFRVPPFFVYIGQACIGKFSFDQ